MNLLALTLFTALTSASAGEPSYMSDAIEDGRTPIVHGQALNTVCESYSVDERGNLSSNFVSDFTIWEVVQAGESGDMLVEGETIELVWGRYNASPHEGLGGCETPRWSIMPQEVNIVALWIDGGVTYVDSWFEGNAGYETSGGEGELPPCGEELQQEVLDELYGTSDPADDDEDPMDEGDPEAASDYGAADDSDAPTGSASADEGDESDKDAAGCSVVGTLTAGHLALGLALVGMARRRRE